MRGGAVEDVLNRLGKQVDAKMSRGNWIWMTAILILEIVWDVR